VRAVFVLLNDTAGFLRHLQGDAGACGASKVLAWGESRSAVHLRSFLGTFNLSAYDGSLLHGLPGWPLAVGPTPPGTGKAIVVNSETDVMLMQAQNVRDPAGSGLGWVHRELDEPQTDAELDVRSYRTSTDFTNAASFAYLPRYWYER
jgi:hypothetical protein